MQWKFLGMPEQSVDSHAQRQGTHDADAQLVVLDLELLRLEGGAVWLLARQDGEALHQEAIAAMLQVRCEVGLRHQHQLDMRSLTRRHCSSTEGHQSVGGSGRGSRAARPCYGCLVRPFPRCDRLQGKTLADQEQAPVGRPWVDQLPSSLRPRPRRYLPRLTCVVGLLQAAC